MGTSGWHPDPTGKPMQRYFDGIEWTENYAPLGVAAAPEAARSAEAGKFTIHYGFVLLAVFAFLGTVIPSIFWFASAANVDTTGPDAEGAQGAQGIMSFFGVGWLLWGGMWTLIWTAFAIQHTLKSRRT
jgi:hypothetical protein